MTTEELQQKIQHFKAALMAMGVDEATADKFLAYHVAHPMFWKKFQLRTLAHIQAGETMGAKKIAEDVRWNDGVGSIKNEFISYYARMFAIKYPAHCKYFDFKQTKGLKAA